MEVDQQKWAEEISLLQKVFRYHQFRLVFAEYRLPQILEKLETELQEKFPERTVTSFPVDGLTYGQISKALDNFTDEIIIIPDFDYILKHDHLRVPFNQSRDRVGQHEYALICCIHTDIFHKLPRLLADWWSVRDLILDLQSPSPPPQGLYIHIPFCRKACHYCDFHFSTVLKYKEEVLRAMLSELHLRKRELPGRSLRSIYFGGGTPSLLSTDEIKRFLEKAAQYWSWDAEIEITLEANPDDLSAGYLRALRRETPVNRLSIGVQSFWEEDLRYMGRIHSAEQALNAIREARHAGFERLSIDLIFGTPTTGNEQWLANLNRAAELQIPHLSCYALTVEDKTALGYRVRKGITPLPPESKAAEQFEMLMAFAERQGYEQYELSNFARAGQRAIHNSLYWQGAPYLGIGPSAHSYNGSCRRWNVAGNGLYLRRLQEGKPTWEEECLTTPQRYNELILTRLRTIEGIALPDIQMLGATYKTHFLKNARPLMQQELLQQKEDHYILTRKGRLLADFVARELFW